MRTRTQLNARRDKLVNVTVGTSSLQWASLLRVLIFSRQRQETHTLLYINVSSAIKLSCFDMRYCKGYDIRIMNTTLVHILMYT